MAAGFALSSINGMRRLRCGSVLRLIDAGVAVLLCAALVLLIVAPADRELTPARLAVGLACALVQAGSMQLIRSRPLWAMGAVLAAGVGLQIATPWVGWLGLVFAPLCAIATVWPPRVSLWALGGVLAFSPWRLIDGGRVQFGLVVVSAALSWAVGELIRTRRVRREQERRRVVAEERARIARELHDVVAHTLSVIIVQAGAAEDAFDNRPEQARQALRALDESARAALGELRSLLRGMAPDPDADPNAPQPGLDQVESLAATVRSAGLNVRLRREGGITAVPAGVDLSAYRIVQESLTNTLRHARATTADVVIRYGADAVELVITDDGLRRAGVGESDGGRRGIVGMRERARLVGGTLEAAPMAEGGFKVRAHLPLEVAA